MLTNAVSEKTRLSVYDANGRVSKQRSLKADGTVDEALYSGLVEAAASVGAARAYSRWMAV